MGTGETVDEKPASVCAATPRRTLLRKGIVGFVGMALLVGMVQAADLTWTGAESATWDATALN